MGLGDTHRKKKEAEADDESEASTPRPKKDKSMRTQSAVTRVTPESGKIPKTCPHPKSKDTLEYKGVKAQAPRYFGHCTIYTDPNRKSWILKLFQNDKHELYYSFRTSPKVSWAELVKHVRSINK